MANVLIRDVPDDVLAALDQRAARLELSRTEYIRRRLARDARTATITITADEISVTTDDWSGSAAPYCGLGASTVDRAQE
ncbi:FitA-like ribbon-helix-helix domain-containing protein [Mycobacterium sp.]|uniref:type II toxin-antitoxin system VapB family antitoxin n=1 Tax=Mycobacterium sp. TaxID=1785 RepID=UPI003BAB751B